MTKRPATKLEYTRGFLESYSHLPQFIQKKVKRHLDYLAQDITHMSLRTRKMADLDGIWEARIDSRYRFTFDLSDGYIRLRALGTHDIYQRP